MARALGALLTYTFEEIEKILEVRILDTGSVDAYYRSHEECGCLCSGET